MPHIAVFQSVRDDIEHKVCRISEVGADKDVQEIKQIVNNVVAVPDKIELDLQANPPEQKTKEQHDE